MLTKLFARFRRVTSSGNYMGEVDGIRFVAIGAVFLFHEAGDIRRHSSDVYNRALDRNALVTFVSQLNAGVQLFFVLSGFILALPFAGAYLRGERPVRLKRYFSRRLTRLEPPYIMAMLLFFGLKLIGGRGAFHALLPHLLASLLYVHNLVFGGPSEINFVAWSLEVEVQFYLLAPLLAWLVFGIRNVVTRRLGTALLCVGLSAIARALPTASVWQISIVGQGAYFLAGLLLADVYCTRGETEPARGWDALCVGAASALLFSRLFASDVWLLGSPLVIALCYYAAFRGVWVRRLLAWTPIATIGGMCYSIYLLHNYIIAVCGFASERVGATLPFAARLGIQAVIMGIPVLFLSSLFYLAIEQPCMRPDWPLRLRHWLSAQLGAVSARVFNR